MCLCGFCEYGWYASVLKKEKQNIWKPTGYHELRRIGTPWGFLSLNICLCSFVLVTGLGGRILGLLGFRKTPKHIDKMCSSIRSSSSQQDEDNRNLLTVQTWVLSHLYRLGHIHTECWKCDSTRWTRIAKLKHIPHPAVQRPRKREQASPSQPIAETDPSLCALQYHHHGHRKGLIMIHVFGWCFSHQTPHYSWILASPTPSFFA